MKKWVIHFLLLLSAVICFAQDTIYLKNPSFEDIPRRGSGYPIIPIKDWTDCGQLYFPSESPPDIHPTKDGAWGVRAKAFDGKTYLGLVTRYDTTREMVSQMLPQKLSAGKCYKLTLSMMMSGIYNSATWRSRETTESFVRPVVLRLWGGKDVCELTELLINSGAVSNTGWRDYILKFRPEADVNAIILEAYFVSEEEYYTGNVMIDNLSPIIEISCQD